MIDELDVIDRGLSGNLPTMRMYLKVTSFVASQSAPGRRQRLSAPMALAVVAFCASLSSAGSAAAA